MKYFLLTGLIGCLLAIGASIAHAPPLSDPATPTVLEPSTDSLSLREKIGLLFIAGHWANTPSMETNRLITEYHLGGVIIMSAPDNPSEIVGWTNQWEQNRNLPLMIAIDQEGGPVSRLKGAAYTQTAQPDITTTDEARAVGTDRGAELQRLGINTNFAPVVERSIHEDSFLYHRVFRDPADIAPLASALISGLHTAGVRSVIKHYPGHEDEAADSHVTLPVVELMGTTFEEHTSPFHELIDTNSVEAVMTAHVLVPDLDPIYPATLSHRILSEELRTKTGFTGVIITDDMSMDAIDTQFTTTEAALLSLQAGADMVLFAAEPHLLGAAIDRVVSAVEQEELPEERIDESVERITRLLEKFVGEN